MQIGGFQTNRLKSKAPDPANGNFSGEAMFDISTGDAASIVKIGFAVKDTL
jgi:hypothetical protein